MGEFLVAIQPTHQMVLTGSIDGLQATRFALLNRILKEHANHGQGQRDGGGIEGDVEP